MGRAWARARKSGSGSGFLINKTQSPSPQVRVKPKPKPEWSPTYLVTSSSPKEPEPEVWNLSPTQTQKNQARPISSNEGKSAASLCSQVAPLFPDIFLNFYLVKNLKIAKNSTTTKAREKNKHRF